MNNRQEKYADIINLPHHISKKHPQMSMEARAAQFAPFSALTGYDDAVQETARFTEGRIEIDEGLKEELDIQLQLIKNKILTYPEVTFIYFIPDNRKQGGKYTHVTGKVKKIDEYRKKIILVDGMEIAIPEIIEINEKE